MQARQSSGGWGYVAIRSIGELLITLGVLVLLFVVYALYFTNVTSARMQQQATDELTESWSQQRAMQVQPVDGEAFAMLRIPAFGADYEFTIQEGVDDDTLDIGPGRYKHTALPGQPGNFGVAGHRVGKGAPFNDLDLLNSCDAIVVETADSFYVYRVLPMSDEVADWEQRKQANPRCENVSTYRTAEPGGGPYGETVGRRIVLPSRGDAVAAVPYRPGNPLPEAEQIALLTLTTCHPQFSARERLIIHAVLTDSFEKTPDATYQQVLDRIGEV